jgi:uncharacterized protein DUF4277
MQGILPEIEVYPVHPLPIIKAYADHLGLVGLIKHSVPTERDVDAGTVVLGLVLDTLSGRSPRYRFAEFFAHQAPELLLGKACPPQAFTDDRLLPTSPRESRFSMAYSHPCESNPMTWR